MTEVGGDSTESLGVKQALKLVVRSALVAGGVSRGLHETAKVLDKREALFCLVAEDCDDENYQKLIRALTRLHDIPLFKVATKAELGELVGQCKYDKEGQARKIVPCSVSAITQWGRGNEEARNMILDHLKKNPSS